MDDWKEGKMIINKETAIDILWAVYYSTTTRDNRLIDIIDFLEDEEDMETTAWKMFCV